MSENYYAKLTRETGEKLIALLALPVPTEEWEVGNSENFDPWELFPIYGSYSG